MAGRSERHQLTRLQAANIYLLRRLYDARRSQGKPEGRQRRFAPRGTLLLERRTSLWGRGTRDEWLLLPSWHDFAQGTGQCHLEKRGFTGSVADDDGLNVLSTAPTHSPLRTRKRSALSMPRANARRLRSLTSDRPPALALRAFLRLSSLWCKGSVR
jgi:hypothetical protein